jgi:hypothetical protein
LIADAGDTHAGRPSVPESQARGVAERQLLGKALRLVHVRVPGSHRVT